MAALLTRAFRHRYDCRHAHGMSIQAPLAERDDRLLPLLGDDADLDLALLDVEDRIRGRLRADLLILAIFRRGSPAVHDVEEHLDVEGLLSPYLRHDAWHLLSR